MTGCLFHFGILVGFHFLSLQCEGKIIDPPAGNTIVTVKGSDVKIDWNFDDAKSSVNLRQWLFIGAPGKRELLGQIAGLGIIDSRSSSLPRVEIQKPGTLKLNNVDRSYNGTYIFALSAVGTTKSHVTLIIAEKPTVTINCSKPTNVTEGKNLTCLCKGEGGNPPANVTWYKDGVQIGDAGDEEKLLTLRNAKKTDSGTYKCVAQSYTLKEKKSIAVLVQLKPTETEVKITPNPATVGGKVTITCNAEGQPTPTYEIIQNDTIPVSKEKTLTIEKVNYTHAGKYKCNATNTLGSDVSENEVLVVKDKGITSTTMTTPKSSTSPTPPDVTSEDGDDGLSVGAIVGIVIGVLVLLVVIIVVLCCKYKDKCGHGVGEQIGQESDEHELEGREHAYDSIQPQSKASASRKAPSESKDTLPPVYATVDKNRKPEGVTYATLDAAAMNSGNKGSRRNEPQPQPAGTEYASIQFGNKDGDSKGAMV